MWSLVVPPMGHWGSGLMVLGLAWFTTFDNLTSAMVWGRHRAHVLKLAVWAWSLRTHWRRESGDLPIGSIFICRCHPARYDFKISIFFCNASDLVRPLSNSHESLPSPIVLNEFNTSLLWTDQLWETPAPGSAPFYRKIQLKQPAPWALGGCHFRFIRFAQLCPFSQQGLSPA